MVRLSLTRDLEELGLDQTTAKQMDGMGLAQQLVEACDSSTVLVQLSTTR